MARIAGYGKAGPYRVVKVYGHPLFEEGEKVYLHQYVISNKIGRRLLDSEETHHKDRNPLNNDPDNLEVKPRSKHVSDHLHEWYATATPEQRTSRNEAISLAKKGKPQPWAKSVGLKLKGLVRTDEFKQKVSKGMKAYYAGLPEGEMARRSVQQGKSRSKPQKGHTDEFKQNASKRMKAYCAGLPEGEMAKRAAQQVKTDELRQKISKGLKAYRAKLANQTSVKSNG